MKDRLKTMVDKRMKTTFIGSLAEFEELFGFLWGFHPERELTSEEKRILSVLDKCGYGMDYWAEVWTDVRKNVLDHGNNQLRLLHDEIRDWNPVRDDFNLVLRQKEGN